MIIGGGSLHNTIIRFLPAILFVILMFNVSVLNNASLGGTTEYIAHNLICINNNSDLKSQKWPNLGIEFDSQIVNENTTSNISSTFAPIIYFGPILSSLAGLLCVVSISSIGVILWLRRKVRLQNDAIDDILLLESRISFLPTHLRKDLSSNLREARDSFDVRNYYEAWKISSNALIQASLRIDLLKIVRKNVITSKGLIEKGRNMGLIMADEEAIIAEIEQTIGPIRLRQLMSKERK
jgi:hypothetical protein